MVLYRVRPVFLMLHLSQLDTLLDTPLTHYLNQLDTNTRKLKVLLIITKMIVIKKMEKMIKSKPIFIFLEFSLQLFKTESIKGSKICSVKKYTHSNILIQNICIIGEPFRILLSNWYRVSVRVIPKCAKLILIYYLLILVIQYVFPWNAYKANHYEQW